MDTIKPIKVRIKKDLYIMKLKVDTNDADYKYHKITIEPHDIPHILHICEVLKNIKSFHNYPSGGRYGFTMERICGSNLKDKFIKGGLKNIESLNVFQSYIGRKTFHTIEEISINNKLLFLSDHWWNYSKRKNYENN